MTIDFIAMMLALAIITPQAALVDSAPTQEVAVSQYSADSTDGSSQEASDTTSSTDASTTTSTVASSYESTTTTKANGSPSNGSASPCVTVTFHWDGQYTAILDGQSNEGVLVAIIGNQLNYGPDGPGHSVDMDLKSVTLELDETERKVCL